MNFSISTCAGVFLLVFLVHSSVSDRILFLLPIASKSHVNVFEPLIRALGERGHDIVNISPVISSKMPPNVQQVQFETIEEIFGELGNPFEMRKMGKLQALVNGSFDSLKKSCERILQSEKFHNLVTKEKYDLVIVDVLMNYCVLGAVHQMETSSIMVSTFAAPPFLANDVGNRYPSSFVADPFLSYTHKMNFIQRLVNVVFGAAFYAVGDYIFIKPGEDMYRKHLPNGKLLPGAHEIQANTSMIFMNSHFTLTYPRPLLPDCVEVGGMHCRPAKPLPKDIDEFLTGSGEDGFIFFSLGSIVPAKVMPEDFRKIFIKVFSKLKLRVIWKWETESMPDTPPNVLLRKWLPQQDILGHPNIKLFMTHGGLLSTQEAAYHGVPLLGIPIFGDQDLNIKQAEASGYAKFFEILELSEEKLEQAINEMIDNKMYTEKARKLKSIVRDLPQTPLQTAVFWTEYVLRHKGAPHLRSAARDLSFWSYWGIDVGLTLALLIFLTSYLIIKTITTIFNRICKKASKNGGKKKLQ